MFSGVEGYGQSWCSSRGRMRTITGAGLKGCVRSCTIRHEL